MASDRSERGTISDEQLEAMRSQIGIETEIIPWFRTVNEDAVWHFALGIGDDNPLWWSREYAEASSVGRMIAPPAFLYAVQAEARKPSSAARGTEGWLPGVLGLHAGDRWVWHRPLLVGEELEVTHQLSDVRELDNGSILQEELLRFFGDEGLAAEMYKSTLRMEKRNPPSRHDGQERVDEGLGAQDLERVGERYAEEAARRRGPDDRYWEDVHLADPLPPILKGPLTITGIVAWLVGAGSPMCFTNRMLYEWFARRPGGRTRHPLTGIEDSIVALHWDDVLARDRGLARGYDIGAQRIAWAAHLITDWCGDTGRLVELDARLRGPNYLGDLTTFRADVTGKQIEGDEGLVECSITGTNQTGVETITAKAKVALPLRGATDPGTAGGGTRR